MFDKNQYKSYLGIIIVFFCVGYTILGCNPAKTKKPFQQKLNIFGKKGVVIIHNALSDTLNLSGYFLEHAPFRKKKVVLSLLPTETDTIINNYNFYDFLVLNADNYGESFWLFNGPGDTLQCYIRKNEDKFDIDFKGSNIQENYYYLSAVRHFGDLQVGATSDVKNSLRDINEYKFIADSILERNVDYLTNRKDLSQTFVAYETNRLKYSSAADRLSTFFVKERINGGTLEVDPVYFAFIDTLAIAIEENAMSGAYLTFTDSYFVYYNRNKYPNQDKTLLSTFKYIDEIYPRSAISDILKIRNLRWIYKNSVSQYDSLVQTLAFAKKFNKNRLDSLFSKNHHRPQIGSKITDIALVNYGGGLINLSDFNNGKMIIINLWASWCKPCISEFRYENKLHADFKDKGLTIINICIETTEDSWREISKQHDLQMINLFFDEEYAGQSLEELKTQLGIRSLPHSILLNNDLIVKDNLFPRASHLNQKEIDSLLKIHRR